MSINEIISQKLSINSKKIQKLTTKTTHCQYSTYEYCKKLSDFKRKKCNVRLLFQNYQQLNSSRWHLYFSCLSNHYVTRGVTANHVRVFVYNLKN